MATLSLTEALSTLVFDTVVPSVGLTIEMTGGSPSGGTEGSTSTAARFQRSLVGAVSLSVSVCSAAELGDVRYCDQYVFPAVFSTVSDSSACPEASVLAMPWSQSLPVAKATEPACV